jgi:hypothetical protein
LIAGLLFDTRATDPTTRRQRSSATIGLAFSPVSCRRDARDERRSSDRLRGD